MINTMNYQNLIDFPFGAGLHFGAFLLMLLALWEIAWKGGGLWQAARNKHLGWFIAILLINTAGILPILYIYVFSPKREAVLNNVNKGDKSNNE